MGALGAMSGTVFSSGPVWIFLVGIFEHFVSHFVANFPVAV